MMEEKDLKFFFFIWKLETGRAKGDELETQQVVEKLSQS
jgi:hypothetical protein